MAFYTHGRYCAAAGKTGRPVAGYEAKIVDDDMNDLPPNTIGKLAVHEEFPDATVNAIEPFLAGHSAG